MQNGKGDKPRSCFSKKFKTNYDQINWHEQTKQPVKYKKSRKIYRY